MQRLTVAAFDVAMGTEKQATKSSIESNRLGTASRGKAIVHLLVNGSPMPEAH